MLIRLLMTTLILIAVPACTENTREVKPMVDDGHLEAISEAYNATVDSDHDEVVCRKEAQTGTRIKQVVCRTRRQLEREHEEGQDYVDKPRPSWHAPTGQRGG